MKKIERLSPPECLDNSIPATARKKVRFYQKLRDKQGEIYPRWNSTCKDKHGVSRIRTRLLEMSKGTCVYCGQHLAPGEMDVDHYLPSSVFPYLAYCWDNLLPVCKYCNQNAKGDFIPSSLKDKRIIEEILAQKFPHDALYHKAHLLIEVATDDRLIEPTFDEPDEHLEFNPEFFFYEARTRIGEISNCIFFRSKEVAERWEQKSLFIRQLVLDDTPKETVLQYIALHGEEYVCLKFYEYWLNEKEAGRIER